MPQRTIMSGLALFLGLLLFLPATARAGDVNAEVQAAYTAGRGLFAKADRGSYERAFGVLDTRKDEALGSIDYWTLYARVWLALEKGTDALWTGVVAERQALNEASPVFDLVRARVATKPDERRRWIGAARKRAPDDVRASVALAVFLLDQEEEDEADELLDKILETHPACEGALLAKARLGPRPTVFRTRRSRSWTRGSRSTRRPSSITGRRAACSAWRGRMRRAWRRRWTPRPARWGSSRANGISSSIASS